MRFNKLLILFFLLLLAAIVFVGCGATIDTVLTADSSFIGNRVITLTISESDMSEVTGGIDALDSIIKSNLPADLTYSKKTNEASDTILTFELSFKNIDDYRTKVNHLFNVGAITDPIPEVTYEKYDTAFKHGIKYDENFDSFDLLAWLFNALQNADIISASSSNWYEIGSNTLILDGSEYNDLYVNNQTTNCLKNCNVVTKFLENGTFEREIAFTADSDTVTTLNQSIGSLEKYLSDLNPSGTSFSSETLENGSYKYTFSIEAADAEGIISATNAILQTQNNTFDVKIAPKEGSLGQASITVSESLDASYYLDGSRYSTVTSTFFMYDNAEPVDYSISNGKAKNEFYYTASTTPSEFTFDWLVNYEKVTFSVNAINEKKVKFSLDFDLLDQLPENLLDMQEAALKEAAKDVATVKKSGKNIKVSFSGRPLDVRKNLNNFIQFFDPEAISFDDPDTFQYVTITINKMSTMSNFSNGILCSLFLDLSPVVGDDSTVVFNFKNGLNKINLLSDHENNECGEKLIYSRGYIKFTSVTTNLFMVLLVVFAGLLIVFSVVFTIIHKNDFSQLFAASGKNPVPTVPTNNPIIQKPEVSSRTVPEQAQPATEDDMAAENKQSTGNEEENT